MLQKINKLFLLLFTLFLIGCSPCATPLTNTTYTNKYETLGGNLYEYKSVNKENFYIEVADIAYHDFSNSYFNSFFFHVGFYHKETKSLLLYQIDYNFNILLMSSFFRNEGNYIVLYSSQLPANLSLGLLKESKYITFPYARLYQGTISLEDFDKLLDSLKYETGLLYEED